MRRKGGMRPRYALSCATMRTSQGLFPTLREAPKDATLPSHALALRAGLMRQVGAGLYELLPLGTKVLRRIEAIIREELEAVGAQEMLMPGVLPAEYLKESGRWNEFGPVLCKLKDRKGAEMALAPTHEEIITDLARRELRSYKQLPRLLFQIQSKFRDEPRPRGGLLRGREFIMKDAYSFDVSAEAALGTYGRVRAAYVRIFERMGLDFRVVQADAGAMGGSQSAEFQVLAPSGEDKLLVCTACDYAANVEVAEGVSPEAQPVPPDAVAPSRVATPGAKTMEDGVRALGEGFSFENTLKTLVVKEGEALVAVVLRGDHALNLTKLQRLLAQPAVALADRAAVLETVGAEPGSIGPVAFPGRVLVDRAAAALGAVACGANDNGVHLRDVRFGRDYTGEVVDLRELEAGDSCPRCGGSLRQERGIEAGHIFVLGTRYSEAMRANFAAESGQDKPLVMGCYGIGVSRLIAATIEQHHDAQGIRWPLALAPYELVFVSLAKSPEAQRAADEVVAKLQAAGVRLLIDDRNERPGVKFKDADLWGIPLRLVLGDRAFEAGEIELKLRGEPEALRVPLENCIETVLGHVRV